ncbi:MAG: 50S ribosomal protein L10 [DPANN group archaeon]|nr:50S ribosomal protein L10 [DPANN group archaeon]
MVQQDKKDKVKELTELMNKYSVINFLELSKLPASQIHSIKKDIRGISKVVVAKKRIIKLAFEQSDKKDIEKLFDIPVAIPGLIFSNENPFKLFGILKRNKAEAFAKVGDKAPHDIVIPAGDTNLAPGPMIGTLQKAKVAARIQGDKIVIASDSKVASEGDIIDANLSSILMQLGIKPMEIGLNVVAAYENGVIFDKNTLDIDLGAYKSNFMLAYISSLNLAVSAVIMNGRSVPILVGKAHTNALNLAVYANVANSETISMFISKAQAQMNSVASRLPENARGSVVVTAQAEPDTTGDKKEEPESKSVSEEKKPDEMAMGLGSLFG